MIIDCTGTILIPGRMGRDCPGNGLHKDVECCCDECDDMMCCLEDYDESECQSCKDANCPRSAASVNK